MGLRVCQLCAVDFTLKYFLLPLIDGMREAGWEVTAVCSDGQEIGPLRVRGYDIVTVRIERSFNLFRHFLSLIALIRLFRAKRFDVVHVHTPVAALIGRLAAWLSGVPVIIYTAHGFYFHDEMPSFKRSVFVFLEKIGGKFSDLLFTQSFEDAETAKDKKLVPAERILAIGNGVDPRRFDPKRVGDGLQLRQELGIPRNAFVIGVIARMVQEKGIRDFLLAAEEAAKREANLYFLMVGERLESDYAGNVAGDLERVSKFLGNKVILTGGRSDIPELLSCMDVFCLPSWREGMPRTVIEAMMMGKAVIATNIRGSREEVIPGVTGYLVPTRDPVLLAKAFLKCAKEPGNTRRMGISGRERALDLYDEFRVVALQIERIKKHLIEMRRVCFVMTSPFAYESFVLPHVERLSSECTVTVCFNRDESSIPVHFPENVRFVSMPIVRDVSPLKDIAVLWRLWLFFGRERFDMVFSITPKGGMVAMFAAALARTKCRVHCFTGQVWATRRGLARNLLQMIDRLLGLAATHLLADSASQRAFLIAARIVPEKKVFVLGSGSICGVDLKRFKPDLEARMRVREQLGLLGNEICLLFVGRLTEEKGVADLLRAFQKVSSRYSMLRLILVGPDERGMAKQWSEVAGVIWVGYSQVAQDYMAASDILCLPSYREGFGLVLIEAAATGLPVVASRIYGITDAVIENETGLLHEPGNVSDIADKIEILVSSYELRRKFSERAQYRAKNEFSMDRVCDMYMIFFRKIMRCANYIGGLNK